MQVKRQLIKALVPLINTTGAKIAAAANVKSPNYYNWLSGKSNALSESALDRLLACIGVEEGKLIGHHLHRWYTADKNASDIRENLLSFNKSEQYTDAQIFNITAFNGQRCNLLKLRFINESILVLCFNIDSQSENFPISADKLGFGAEVNLNHIPNPIFNKWANPKKIIGLNGFIEEARTILSTLDLSDITIKRPAIKHDINFAAIEQELINMTASNAGLKAIIRRMLKELRDHQPNCKLLDDGIRKEIYDADYEHERMKLTKPDSLEF